MCKVLLPSMTDTFPVYGHCEINYAEEEWAIPRKQRKIIQLI